MHINVCARETVAHFFHSEFSDRKLAGTNSHELPTVDKVNSGYTQQKKRLLWPKKEITFTFAERRDGFVESHFNRKSSTWKGDRHFNWGDVDVSEGYLN